MTRYPSVVITAVAALSFAASAPASAAVFIYTGSLSGTQEVPTNASPGTGTVIVTYDDVTQLLNIQSTFAQLLGTTTVAHIHCCAATGANAGVATVPNLPGLPLGVSSGSVNTTLDLNTSAAFNTPFITNNGGTVASARAVLVGALNTNRTYFNLHSTQFPGGEIRAQLIAAVPEPTTWAMMILGFSLVGGSLRLRRSALVAA